MSGKCGDCDCQYVSQCKKKGYTADIIETEESYMEETMVVDAPVVAEHNCKCKCGSSCACIDCKCGH